MFNKTTLIPLVSLVLGLLAYFHVIVPEGFTADTIATVLVLVAAAATAILRFNDGHYDIGVKKWYLSKVVWTQIGAATIAVFTLFGIKAGFAADDIAKVGMMVAMGLAVVFGAGEKPRLG